MSTEERKQLLQLVEEECLTIKEAAVRLGINYSTAKTILQLFKKTGRIEKIENIRFGQLNINEYSCAEISE